MPDIVVQSPFEIGRRIELRGADAYSWFVILDPTELDGALLENFAEELEATIESPVRVVPVRGLSLDEVRQTLHSPPDDVAILAGFESYRAASWGIWDIHRTGLVRPGSIVLWLSPTSLTELCVGAPNLRSFIGGSIIAPSRSGAAMTLEESSERIRELEAHYNMSSADVVQQATSRTLPPEPHFVEWLVLLGRGDLV